MLATQLMFSVSGLLGSDVFSNVKLLKCKEKIQSVSSLLWWIVRAKGFVCSAVTNESLQVGFSKVLGGCPAPLMPGRWMNAPENPLEIPKITANQGPFFYVCPCLWPPLLEFWDVKNKYLEENFIRKTLLYIFYLSFNFSLKESKTPVSKRKKNSQFHQSCQ